MSEPKYIPPDTPAPEWYPPSDPDPGVEVELRHRREMLRRLRLLLLFGAALFTLLIWRLVRMDDPSRLLLFAPEPARVVRRHLEALNRGEFREAYLLFSQHYQDNVSFALYHELVVTHSEIFRTRLLSLNLKENSPDRAILDTRLLAADGEHYVARFTLVRAGNRWWIDDLHWGSEADQQRGVISV